MKTIQVSDAETHFSTLLRDVGAGKEIAISYGKQKEKIAVIVPYSAWKKTKKRELGTIKNPRGKPRGIEDFSLKSLRMRGNISPAPPVLTAPRGGELNPQWLESPFSYQGQG
jgi:antitoxin (DNA-binding transcriptional repressor) of toxin-antitoxin stability system